MPKFFHLFSMLFAGLWLSACASVSVNKVNRGGAKVPPAPVKIYVQDFELPKDVLRVDRGGDSLDEFQKNFREDLTGAIAERTAKRLAPAMELRRGAKLPRERAWLVTGRFLTVNQGSRALRSIVGFGAGGTKIETFVTVYDLSGRTPRPFLKFVTTGGSNAQPGAAVGLIAPNYWLLAVDVIGKGLPGLNADLIRTSREIVAVLSEYMAQEGYLPLEKVSRAKRLGRWP